MISLPFQLVALTFLCHNIRFTNSTFIRPANIQRNAALAVALCTLPEEIEKPSKGLYTLNPPNCRDYRHYIMELDRKDTGFIGSPVAVSKQLWMLIENLKALFKRTGNFNLLNNYIKHYIHSQSICELASSERGRAKIKKVFVQSGDVLYPGDLMIEYSTTSTLVAMSPLMIFFVNVAPNDVVIEHSVILAAIDMNPSPDCKHYNQNWQPTLQYSWPIETSWRHLNRIFLANEGSFSRPFKGCAPYIALNEAYEATGKIAVYASFFQGLKYHRLKFSIYDLELLCISNEIPAGAFADMRLFNKSGAYFYEAATKREQHYHMR